ncbi:MAG: response regulator [Bacteroidia bacterium]
METNKLNLFVVDDDRSTVAMLKNYLNRRFGASLNISTFYNGESCLEHLNDETHIVVLDYYLTGKNGLEVLKSIKQKSPGTEVIMFSNNEEVGAKIESLQAGAAHYVVKGKTALKNMTSILYGTITAPLRAMVREFGVTKFMAIFLLTFAGLGIIVAIVLTAMGGN